MERTTIPIAPDTSDLFLDRLLHPGRFFDSPDDVVADPGLTLYEKRAILSSWASDACAVESMPALRHPPGVTRPVSFDDIMDALAKLDGLLDEVIGTGDSRQESEPEVSPYA
jgi:hypothetical protein